MENKQYVVVMTDMFNNEILAPVIFSDIDRLMGSLNIVKNTGWYSGQRTSIKEVQAFTIKKTGRHSYDKDVPVTEKFQCSRISPK